MSDNELLMAMSEMLDAKLDAKLGAELQPIKDDIRNINLHLENVTDRNIQLLAENYVPAAKRYEQAAAEMDVVKIDVDILKKVVADHSKKLQKVAL